MKKYIAACIMVATVSGCDSNSATANSSKTPLSSSAGDSVSANVAEKGIVSLGSAAINLEAALGKVPAVVTAVGPCPFLSDDVARSTVKTSYELERRQISNSECRWSYNAGFSLKVTVEPIDTATPLDQRRYNIGVDTQLEPQNGPGKNAALVSDTAWDKPVPFGYGFELDGDAVFIRVTGMKTDRERLRATADEIASLLLDAPIIEAQRRTESVTFEPCSVWQNAAIQNALEPVKYSPVSSHPSGSSCIYKAYGEDSGKALTLTIRFGELDAKYHAKAIEKGHEDVQGFEFPVSVSIEAGDFGTYTKITAYVDGGAIEIFILDGANVEHKDTIKQLLQNVASRLNR
jgi:hypothetical protein